MTKKKNTLKLRPANDVLEPSKLSRSRIARVNGSSLLFLVSPQVLEDEHATRHLTILTRVGNENTMADGLLRAKYWSINFFDPSDWYAKFKRIDEVLNQIKAKKEQSAESKAA